MEEKTNLSPEESLKLIAETIERTKSNVQTGSFYFLLWLGRCVQPWYPDLEVEE